MLICQESKLLTLTVPFVPLEVTGLTTFHIDRSMFPRATGKVIKHRALTRESGSVKGVDLLKSVQSKAVSQAVPFTQSGWLELLHPQLSDDKLSPVALRGH